MRDLFRRVVRSPYDIQLYIRKTLGQESSSLSSFCSRSCRRLFGKRIEDGNREPAMLAQSVCTGSLLQSHDGHYTVSAGCQPEQSWVIREGLVGGALPFPSNDICFTNKRRNFVRFVFRVSPPLETLGSRRRGRRLVFGCVRAFVRTDRCVFLAQGLFCNRFVLE